MANLTGKGGFGENPQNINRAGHTRPNSQFQKLFEKKMPLEDLVSKLADLVKGGDKQAVFYSLDRFFGKAKETKEIDLPQGIEITIKGERKNKN